MDITDEPVFFLIWLEQLFLNWSDYLGIAVFKLHVEIKNYLMNNHT